MEAVIPILLAGSFYIISKNKNEPNQSRNKKYLNGNHLMGLNPNQEQTQYTSYALRNEEEMNTTTMYNHNENQSQSKNQNKNSLNKKSQSYKEGYGNIYNDPKLQNKKMMNKIKGVYKPQTARYKNVDNDMKHQNSFSYIENENNELDNSRIDMFTSLTGEIKNVQDMKHANMKPFFGSTVKQPNGEYDRHESVIDHKVGRNSYDKSKRSVGPLFKPNQHMSWNNGTPNFNEKIQQHIVPSLRQNNTKPFEEIRVGPSLNREGDNVLGEGGFNSGMLGREQWLPKTVDDLRVKNNQKESFEGVVLGGKYSVTNRGILGKTEKYLPDTYYVNTPERYFTTTGIEKAPTKRAVNVFKDTNRIDTTNEHYGGSNRNTESSYIKQQYQKPKRPVLDPYIKQTSNLYGPYHDDSKESSRIKTYESSVLTNNRSTNTELGDKYGMFTSAVKAMVAPVVDMIRPTRKSNTIGAIRSSGNPQSYVPNHTVFNPNDKTRTTIREMTEERKDHMFVGNQNKPGHQASKHQPVNQQRDTTSVYHTGNMGNTSGTSNMTLYDSAYNAHLIDKTDTLKGRLPNGNIDKFSGSENYNLQVNKKEPKSDTYLYNPSNLGKVLPSKEMLGMTQSRNTSVDLSEFKRMDGDLLKPFHDNPYTKSLSNY